MLTISLEQILKEPINVLSSILFFIWRDDWEWEGHGGKYHEQQGLPPLIGWKQKAEDLVMSKDGSELLQKLLEQSAAIVDESISTAKDDSNSNAFKKSIQGAFASEMKRSSDMTSWPCPSFWDGVNLDEDGQDQMQVVLQRISSEMVPNCSDDDPFARCTVNKDRCEVKRDAKCK